MKKLIFISLCIIFTLSIGFITGCKKLLVIPPPPTSITTNQVFADSTNASAAIMGMYTFLAQSGSYPSVGNGQITFLSGVSADELSAQGNVTNNPAGQQLYTNTLMANNGVSSILWAPAYQAIYLANGCIEGVTASKGINTATKNEFIGEAEFVRAFMNFYLVNIYGDVPLVTSTNYTVNASLPRASASAIYQSIIADLKDAQSKLPDNYQISSGQRIRVNKWAATALLARVYLFEPSPDYANASLQANSIIANTSLFSLVSDLSSVFNANGSEAILQWNLNTSIQPYNATAEGYGSIPPPGYVPQYNGSIISPQLLAAFEPGDMRKTVWLDTISYSGVLYYYPFKYTIGSNNYTVNGNATQYYMILRLAEQYLIRAEANAHLGKLPQAINDLNQLRNRAGLAQLSSTLTQAQVLAAVAQERRIELFCEWGHRWLDLKRTGQIDSVMSLVTPHKLGATSGWKSYQKLYPIPTSEIQVNPHLTQNPGY
ncbi:MAG TPA: RagB/SusD family nutrient uptake outer membrane protein [Mucilaginibacter sp.]|jgi:hypothetical protein|nr:RagB/SusD family nutrient uptake outer membrane protein [Mucilaginibacter sp.]